MISHQNALDLNITSKIPKSHKLNWHIWPVAINALLLLCCFYRFLMLFFFFSRMLKPHFPLQTLHFAARVTITLTVSCLFFFFMESFVVEFDASALTCFSFMHYHEILRFSNSVCVWGCFLVSKRARGCIFCLLHLSFCTSVTFNFTLLVAMGKLKENKWSKT